MLDDLFRIVLDNVSHLILTTTVCVLLYYVFSWKRRGLPPGPKYRLPLIGHLHLMNADMRICLRKFRKQYGDVYSLYLGSKLTIIISGYDALKDAFLKNGDTFSNRPIKMKFIDQMTKGLGVVHSSGDLWKEHRRFTLQTLKNFGMGKSILEDKIHGEVLSLIGEFQKHLDIAFDPKVHVSTSVSNVICSLCFGGKFEQGDPRFVDLLQKLEENFHLAGFSGILHFMPILEILPGDLFSWKRVTANQTIMSKFVKDVIKQHIESFDENEINDYTSAYIKEMKNQKATNSSTTFTVDQLVGVILDLFTAGTETTSTALRWALVYLVNYPDIQEQIYEIIIKVVGTDRLPSLQDKNKLPQVDAFMMEIMRHAQLGFTSLGRATSKDINFRGFLIPHDALILPDVDSVNHDSAIWVDPEVFRPDRFISEDNTLLKPEEFVAFFLGKRNCLGESLAKMELFLFISGIVQTFKITAPPGEDMSLNSLDGLFGLTHEPKSFRIVARSRKVDNKM